MYRRAGQKEIYMVGEEATASSKRGFALIKVEELVSHDAELQFIEALPSLKGLRVGGVSLRKRPGLAPHARMIRSNLAVFRFPVPLAHFLSLFFPFSFSCLFLCFPHQIFPFPRTPNLISLVNAYTVYTRTPSHQQCGR